MIRDAAALLEEPRAIHPAGRLIDVPLDVHTDVAWVGYANRVIAEAVAPVLAETLRARGVGPDGQASA